MRRMYGKQWKKFDKEVRHFKMTPIEMPKEQTVEEAEK
jgi:hypothetical protein